MNETDFPLSPAAIKAGWVWMALQFTLLPQLVGLLRLDNARSNLLFHALCALATVAIFRRALLEGLRRGMAHWQRFVFVCTLALAGYYAAGGGVNRLIGWLDPSFLNRNDQSLLEMQVGWPLLLTTVVLAPVSEECLFRGLLFTQAGKRSRAAGYSLSCLCFALVHVLGYLGTYTPRQFALALLQYIPAGLMLAWSCEKSQTLTAPIALHAIINAISIAQLL